METKELVNQMTNFVNTMSSERNEEFNKFMAMEHRTLQQSFTRLCVGWLEHVASEEYRFDDRNKAAHEFGKLFVKLFKEYADTKENDGSNGFYIAKGHPLKKHFPMI